MLADAMTPVYFILSPLAALASLLAAIVLETPILWLLWRCRPATILKWVILANAASAVAGVAPIVWYGLSGNLLDVDPWQVYQTYWLQQLRLAALLLGVSLVIEGIVYARRAGLRFRQLFAGIFLSNLASYALLLAYAWLGFLARTPAGFTILPDTQAMNLGAERVWFIDWESRQLCSIRLDGSDRRTELASPMAGYWFFPHRIYAVAPAEHAILYIDDNFKWRISRNGEDRQLLTEPAEDPWYLSHADAWLQVRQALQAANIAASTRPEGSQPELFYYAWDWPIWNTEQQNERYQVRSVTLPNGLAFAPPLTITRKSDGQVREFFLTDGARRVGCWEPAILDDLILFRCGAWIMVMDVNSGKVGRLVRGYNLMLETPAFGPPSQPTTTNNLAVEG